MKSDGERGKMTTAAAVIVYTVFNSQIIVIFRKHNQTLVPSVCLLAAQFIWFCLRFEIGLNPLFFSHSLSPSFIFVFVIAKRNSFSAQHDLSIYIIMLNRVHDPC